MARRPKQTKPHVDPTPVTSVVREEMRGNTKGTDARLTVLLEGLAVGLTRADACAAAGIARETLAAWLRDARDRPATSPWRNLPPLVEAAEVRPARVAMTTVMAAAEAGDLRAAEILLKRRKGYEERKAVEVTGADGGPVQVAATVALERLADRLRDLPDEALDAVAEGEDDAG